MIFITTEDLLNRLSIPFEVSLKHGRKHLKLQIIHEQDQKLVSAIETALNARLSGDSINYELAISSGTSKDLNKISENILNILTYLIFESGLTNYSFINDENTKTIQKFKSSVVTLIKKHTIQNDLVIAICILDSIFSNNLPEALELCTSIKNEINLKLALQAFIHFQTGQVEESLKILNETNLASPENIFLHLSRNLKAFICIQDGRLSSFETLNQELNSLVNKENSHLAPMIQANLFYLDTSNDKHLPSVDRHYKNVLLFHESKELDLLDNLKTKTIGLIANEVYENMDIYGKETIRFNNTPDSVAQKLSRYIFLNSFTGNHSGFSEGCHLFLKAFFTLGDMYKDQSLYKEALRNAVRVGSPKDIEKIIKTPAFIKDTDTILYFDKMISDNPYGGATAIGVSCLIKNTYQFISKESAPFVVKHLKKEIQNKFSFSSNFDHARPALEALYFASHTLPEDKGIELFQAFSEIAEELPLNVIGIDIINKVTNNLPKKVIRGNALSSQFLIDFYFKNIDIALKVHFETTLLSLSWLIQNHMNSDKTKFLDLLNKELSQSKEKASRTIFLLDRIRELLGSLSQEQASSLANLVLDEILTPASQGYSNEVYGTFDPLLISTRSFDYFPSELQEKYLERLVSCLFDTRSSITNKTRIIHTLDFLAAKIDPKYFKALGELISHNRASLFASANADNRSPFRSSSFVNFRALLYSCAAIAPIEKPASFSLDLLRLSVSTEPHVRELFAESVVYFINANPNCAGNLSLLHRCYELTFDSDPKVRGIAISTIIELFESIEEEIKNTYLVRITDLASDSSEITRAYLAQAISKFEVKLPPDQLTALKVKLRSDVSFYVRRNIDSINADE